mgnify:CR=1 FL=1
MKVVQIITSLNVGGAEKILVDSIPFYQRRGVTPDVVALLDKPTLLIEQLKRSHKGKLY